MHSIDRVRDLYIPAIVRDEICSFIPMHLLRNSNQYRRRMYFRPECYEFYMIKPTPTFAPVVWLDRILSRGDSDNGVKLHALAKFETEYGSLDDMELTIGDPIPTRASLLHSVMAKFSLDDHEVCNSAFNKLLENPNTKLTHEEVRYIEYHFASDWIIRIDARMFDEHTTLETIERGGFAMVAFAMLWGILQSPYLNFQVKREVVHYLTLCAAADDRCVFSVGVVGRCVNEFREMVAYLAKYQSDDASERAVMLKFSDQLGSLIPYGRVQ